MSNSNEIVVKIENCNPKDTQKLIKLLSNNPNCYTKIIPTEPIPVETENPFKHYGLDEKLQTLSALTTAFTATKGSYVHSDIEKRIVELLESFQE